MFSSPTPQRPQATAVKAVATSIELKEGHEPYCRPIDSIEGTVPNLEMLQVENSLPRLISLLKQAYSGEQAAALAYQGHARSVNSPYERKMIAQIEQEEWQHRREVGEMLESLEARPSKLRELVLLTVGKTLSFGCHLTGRFLPMYFAAKLESANIQEYESAAELARELDLFQMADRLALMAQREREHEQFFKSCIASRTI
jgi:rubrerythrin